MAESTFLTRYTLRHMIQIRVYNLSTLISHSAHSSRSWDTPVDKIADFTSCILFHTLVFTHACGHSWHSGLIYSTHILVRSPLMSPLFSVCVCWKPPVRGYCCPGLRRRFLLRALQLFCRCLGYRCVRGRSPTGRPEKKDETRLLL